MERIDIEKVPEEVYGVKLDEILRDRLANGLETGVIEGFVFDDGSVNNAKVRLSQDEKGNVHLGFRLQKEELAIPDHIGDYKLTDFDKENLSNGKISAIELNGNEYFLQVDKELNSVVVKKAQELDIRDVISAKHEKGTLKIGDNYKPTDDEVKKLLEGKKLDPKLIEIGGQYITAKVSLTEDFKGLKFEDIREIKNVEKAKQLEKRLNNPQKTDITEKIISTGADIIDSKEKKNVVGNTAEIAINVIEPEIKEDIKSKLAEQNIQEIENKENLEKKDFLNEKSIGKTIDTEIEREITVEKHVVERATENEPKNEVEIATEKVSKKDEISEKIGNSDSEQKPNLIKGSRDGEFLAAVKDNNFDKLIDMKKEGYKPSEFAIENMKNDNSITDHSKTGVKAMFSIEDKKEKKDFSTSIDKTEKVKSKENLVKKGGGKGKKFDGERIGGKIKEVMNVVGNNV